VRRLLITALLAWPSCRGGSPPLPASPPPPATYFVAERTDATFLTADHFLAAIEMQISGEPFAQLLGRNLAGYDRFNPKTDLYQDPDSGRLSTDTLGYSIAVESYEYSKQPMNNTSFESGAGLALQYGPVLNPTGVNGDAAVDLLRARVQQLAIAANAGGPPGANFVVIPAPAANPLNVYGWPGFFPVFAEFSAFDTAITPNTGGNKLYCSFTQRYGGTAGMATIIGDYECSYNSLNLGHRDQQVVKILAPDALGYATWKQALWSITYWGSMHDVAGNPITDIADADITQVGISGNTVVGKFADPNDPTGQTMVDGVPGVYLGDIVLEGFQGLTMTDEMDNKAALLLRRLLTSDGATMGGFASTKAALDYDYASPLRWWPAQVGVTESAAAQPPARSAYMDPTWTSWSCRPRSCTALNFSGRSITACCRGPTSTSASTMGEIT